MNKIAALFGRRGPRENDEWEKGGGVVVHSIQQDPGCSSLRLGLTTCYRSTNLHAADLGAPVIFICVIYVGRFSQKHCAFSPRDFIISDG
jgi:hypothetical protein